MNEIVCYMPTYSPETEADSFLPRFMERASQQEILERFHNGKGKFKPMMYMDCIDSILNIRPDIKLVVADARSTDSIRIALRDHNSHSDYALNFYSERLSQWGLLNDVIKKFTTPETKYFIYSSSDIIWHMDWVSEAIKEFKKNPKVQILFPCVNKGDPNLPCQIAPDARDLDSFIPPYQDAAKARVLNAYVMIFKMDFFHTYGGYPTLYRNCFTESFLSFMCEAMGGEMRVLPRGHCYHWGEGDKWTAGGSPYYYNEEKMIFQSVMNKVLMARAMKLMGVDFLKETLYKKAV